MTYRENTNSRLPDPESAERFLVRLEESHPAKFRQMSATAALRSDVVTLASYSPLLAATLLQNPEYIAWLGRERMRTGVRGTEDLLESLARFSLTHSGHPLHILLSRFRRRELLRIFLGDIRRLATTAEVTEDISNLADAILENALRAARQDLDNRYGSPSHTDENGRITAATFCIVSLGKLGSKELNYASDIDLLYLYSADGETSSGGSRGILTNREYFIKLAEAVTRTVGQHSGEGAAYRVDLRLRPHGRVGPLAISVNDAVRYYTSEAAAWEKQVLIRSRASAGDAELYRALFSRVESSVFSTDRSAVQVLEDVRRSKQRIDDEQRPGNGIDIKLGPGGIREIEFIAQALQLAYGGKDRWLRAPHTLISLSRLADRGLITEVELTKLFGGYEFLRRLEHILQMENGLQTHLVPADEERRALIAAKMGSSELAAFESQLEGHTSDVRTIFTRVFGPGAGDEPSMEQDSGLTKDGKGTSLAQRSDTRDDEAVDRLAALSPRFAELLKSHREIAAASEKGEHADYLAAPLIRLAKDVLRADAKKLLEELRRSWRARMAAIIAADIAGKLSIADSKRAQAALAVETVDAAIDIAGLELQNRTGSDVIPPSLSVLALGKLGGGGLDHDSDLDLILVYDDEATPGVSSSSEYYTRAGEALVNLLSGVTREGSLYRIDLRLRPYGKNGPVAASSAAFLEYIRRSAAIWELLAYVKMRAAAGNIDLAAGVERDALDAIHERAAAIDASELAAETMRIRLQLEKERGPARGGIDIKYGSGGMLDVYFAVRFLQLRSNLRDHPDDRSTVATLRMLTEAGRLEPEDQAALAEGYQVLSACDHFVRLLFRRSTRLPLANKNVMDGVARRMGLGAAGELLEQLAIHRMNIRNSFEKILKA